MEGINLNHIAQFIDGMTCSAHGNIVSTQVDGDNVIFNNVCCGEFQHKIDDAYLRQIDLQMKNKFNGLL